MQEDIEKGRAYLLIFLFIFFYGCTHTPEKSMEISDRTEKEEGTLPEACTADSDCPSGSSCWYQVPRGPLPGVRGSKEKPGKCYKDDVLKRVY